MLLAFIAGMLSTLSPCVLPLIPIVLTSAGTEHRLAPFSLAAGLALSFAAIGLFVATIGFSIGLDMGAFRTVGAALIIAMGTVLVLPRLQARFTAAAGPMSDRIWQRFGTFSTAGISGQFGVGVLLGAIWTPCVGPTLGAVSVMAGRGENIGAVTLMMLAFGVGTAVPLLVIGMLSREVLDQQCRWKAENGSWGASCPCRHTCTDRTRPGNSDGPDRNRAGLARLIDDLDMIAQQG